MTVHTPYDQQANAGVLGGDIWLLRTVTSTTLHETIALLDRRLRQRLSELRVWMGLYVKRDVRHDRKSADPFSGDDVPCYGFCVFYM